VAILDPREPAFWEQERDLLADALDDLILDILLRGAQSGADMMPDGFDLLINWDAFNTNAIAFLRQYQLDTIQGITNTTRGRVVNEIEAWIRDGTHLDDLKRRLRPLFTDNRADAIAITEVTRIYAQGNMMSWQATGMVSGKRWQTARDERVCPFCGPLHGKIVSLSADFTLSPEDLAKSPQLRNTIKGATNAELLRRASELLGRQGDRVLAPPYHPRCRCWLQPFVSADLVRDQRLRDLGLLDAFFAMVDNKVVHYA